MENENIVTLQLKFTRDKALLLLAVFFLCWHPRPLGSETLQLTTYYPAPYGGYVSLLTTGRTLLARDSNSVGIGTPGPVPANVALAVYSRTTQGNISISGVSDAGHTYSSLTLNDDNLQPTINSWGLVHKKTIGTVRDNDFQIVRSVGGMIREDFVIDWPTGNVGIGTYSPARRLDVAGDAHISGDLYLDGNLRNFCARVAYSAAGITNCPGGMSVMGFQGDGVPRVQGFLPASQTSSGVGSYIVIGEDWGGSMVCCRFI